MTKVAKNSLKAKQNQNRVNLYRAWTSIRDSGRNQQPSASSNLNATQNSDTAFRNIHIRESIRRWALKFNISKRAINDLLKTLISFGMTSLPRDSRSLLETPRSVELKSLTNGKIW